MKILKSVISLSLLVAFAALMVTAKVGPATAGDKDPLFVNLVSDDAHAATMALHFAKTIQAQGHQVTVFFNNRGVIVASKGHVDTYPGQQKNIAELSGGGAVLIACPHCMEYYGIKDSGLVSGVVVGEPDMVSKQLFMDDTKTLTW